MSMTDLKPTIDSLASKGITVWIELSPERVRIVLKDRTDKLAKQDVEWGDDLAGRLEMLAKALAP